MAEILKLVNGSGGRAASPLPEAAENLPELDALPEKKARELITLIEQIDPKNADTLAELGAHGLRELTEAVEKVGESVSTLGEKSPGDTLREIGDKLGALVISDNQDRARRTLVEIVARQIPPGRKLRKQLSNLVDVMAVAGEDLSALRVGRENAQLDLRDAYRSAISAFDEISLSVAAGKERMQRDSGKLAEKVAKTISAEAKGKSGNVDKALAELRTARDGIERRLHTLRRARNMLLESLPVIREMSDGEGALNVALSEFLRISLPNWDAAVADVVSRPANNRDIDVDAVEACCLTFAGELRQIVELDEGLAQVR